MRLTLRTLLAYLDDVLAPAEAELLQKRIEESEFAATLVQRIRHAVKRLRLSAPKVDGKGIGFDANSVADYLDSVLPTERMAEFERVCLESDVHLAEVAACHQILCKVLKEPAHVTHELKERIHKLPALAKAGQLHHASARHGAAATGQHPASHGAEQDKHSANQMEKLAVSVVGLPTVAPVPVQPAVAKAEPAERVKLEVPDYLKPEPTTSRWQLLGVLAFMAIAAVVLIMMSPLGQSLAPGKWFGQQPEIVVAPPIQPTDNTSTPDDSAPPPENEADKTIAKDSPLDKLKPFVEEKDPTKKPVVDNGVPPVPEEAVPPLAAKGPDKKPDMPAEKIDAPPQATPPVAENAKPNPEKANPEKADVATAVKPSPENSVGPVTEKEPMAGDVGKYISDETVLVKYDKGSKNWVRIPSRALVQGGERIVSLPVFRPQLALSTGMQVTLVGEASVAFDRGVNSPIAMQAEYGKFLFVTAGIAGSSIDMHLNGIRGQLLLSSNDAEAAVDVQSYLPPGEDPSTATPVAALYVFALKGSVTWKTETGEEFPVKANFARVLIAGRESLERGPLKLPAWVDARKTLPIEREAAKTIEPLLHFDRPVMLSLEELASHRKVEVRSLVARSLAWLENYQVLLRQLAEEEYKAYWTAEIDILRAQIARGGSVARELESQLDKQRGAKDGTALYRLLWGFSEEQLLGNSAEHLVEQLENVHPDIRLLAYDNLRRVTGVTHSYNPAYAPEKNRSALLRWTRAQKSGEIVYAVKPSPIAELQSLAVKPEAEK